MTIEINVEALARGNIIPASVANNAILDQFPNYSFRVEDRQDFYIVYKLVIYLWVYSVKWNEKKDTRKNSSLVFT